jgi:hypothetical protein
MRRIYRSTRCTPSGSSVTFARGGADHMTGATQRPLTLRQRGKSDDEI